MNKIEKTHGTGRPSTETAAVAWTLLVNAARQRRRYPRVGDLHSWRKPEAQQPLVVALDAAILAGEDSRMLTTNLIFDALATRWSQTYHEARKKGPARVSWEMHPDVLNASLHDLRQHGLTLVQLGALLGLVQHGCGLYQTERSPGRGYTVELTDETEALREEFIKILAGDGATGGHYWRRGSKKRLLFADENAEELPVPADSLDEGDGTDADASNVAAGWAYNIATPGPKSREIIHRLEATRLYLDVMAFRKEYKEYEKEDEKEGRLVQRRNEIDVKLWDDYKVDVTESPVKPRGGGRSARQRAMKHLKQRDVPAVKALVEEYDTLVGQINQVREVCRQLGELSAHGEIEIRSRFYKLSNRRYQSADFWPTEVSGKDVTRQFEIVSFPEGRLHGLHVDTTRRGRLFLAAATRPHTLLYINRLRPLGDDNAVAAAKRLPLVGVDVSSSQVQILAVFLGLGDLEDLFKGRRYWDIVAERACARDQDKTDDFTLPHGFSGAKDRRLQDALKKTVMTWLYNNPLTKIVDTLDASPSEYGPGLGSMKNIKLLLDDEKLKLHGIDNWFKPACRLIAQQAWEADPYLAGLTFTDPLDETVFRWNPIRWKLEPCAGSGDVKIYAKVPYMEWKIITGWTKKGMPRTRYEWFPAKPNVDGDYPVDRAKLGRSIAPCLTHMLDAAFAGFVVKNLNALGVRDIVSIHDAFLVAEDAAPALDAAVAGAGEPWLRALGPVYDDLERYLGQDARYGPWVRGLRQQWADRVARRDWPRFRVGKVPLVSEIRSTSRAGRVETT